MVPERDHPMTTREKYEHLLVDGVVEAAMLSGPGVIEDFDPGRWWEGTGAFARRFGLSVDSHTARCGAWGPPLERTKEYRRGR